MVVLGGRSDPDEFSSDVLLYQVNCNTWLLPDLTRESLLLCPGRQPCGALSTVWGPGPSLEVTWASGDPSANSFPFHIFRDHRVTVFFLSTIFFF